MDLRIGEIRLPSGVSLLRMIVDRRDFFDVEHGIMLYVYNHIVVDRNAATAITIFYVTFELLKAFEDSKSEYDVNIKQIARSSVRSAK